MQIRFLGAVETATGSSHLVRVENENILIDCGISDTDSDALSSYQLLSSISSPSEIDAIVLTNAHLNHSGFMPILVRDGFKKKIYCSELTFILSRTHWLDYLQSLKEDKIIPRPPKELVFSEADIENCLKQMVTIPWDKPMRITRSIILELCYAGHFPGVSQAILEWNENRLVFSGSIGRSMDPIMLNPSGVNQADFLILESTLGDIEHIEEASENILWPILSRTIHRGGSVLIPTSNIGRIRTLLYFLSRLKNSGALRNSKVYHDTPVPLHADDLRKVFQKETRIKDAELDDTCTVATQITDFEESVQLSRTGEPKIILAGDSVLGHGRVLRHLKNLASDPLNTILLAEYQPKGTRGYELINGAKTLPLDSQTPVRAEVVYSKDLCAHSDSGEICGWLKRFTKPPKATFIIHGEEKARIKLRDKIQQELGWITHIPTLGEQVHLVH